MNVSSEINCNINFLRDKLIDCNDLVEKELFVGKNHDIKVYLCYFDLMTDRKLIEHSVVESIVIGMKEALTFLDKDDKNIYDLVKKQGITTVDYVEETNLDKVLDAILSGDTLVLVENSTRALIISTKGFPNRGIQSAENEVVLEGSRESFSEVFRFNSVLIRRRIKDTRLKIYQTKVGRRSKTDIGVMYIEDIAYKELVDKIIQMIESLNIDAVLDLCYFEELLFGRNKSPFPQVQKTERPDKASSALLEGRIVLIMDNTPQVMILPTIFSVFFQSSEDYYDNFFLSSSLRILRFLAFIISIGLPGIFLAITIFHPSLISRDLMFKIAGTRTTVPFTPLVEMLVMELAFELLREAGLRLPSRVGGTLGIVGGLIIGQSAVEAGLTSPTVVIVVALTAISTFAIPSIALTNGIRLVKYFITIMSGLFGFLGLTLSMLTLLIHLMSLNSFGIPYMYPFVSSNNDFEPHQDTLIRMPFTKMIKRPIFAKDSQKTRQKKEF
ncbi:MAG: spore germination protein [Lachnospirales bacterium]